MFTPLHETLKSANHESGNLFKFPQKISSVWLIMQMHTYIIWFTLLTFHSVAVSAGLEEVLNVAKCIADIHQELPNNYVFFMMSEGEKKVRIILFFSLNECSVFEKGMCSDFKSSNAASLIANTLLKEHDMGKLWEYKWPWGWRCVSILVHSFI